MIKFLLDTSVFIWSTEDNKLLGSDIAKILKDPENQIYLSVASLWEMIIKKEAGKLKLPRSWKSDLKSSDFLLLPIALNHVYELKKLPQYHNPFDRIIIAQARAEKLKLISSDKMIWRYKVNLAKA